MTRLRLVSAHRLASVFTAGIAIAALVAPQSTRAADYTEVKVSDYVEMATDPDTPLDAGRRSWRKVTQSPQLQDIKSMLRGDVALDAPAIDKFFKKFWFPQFTLIKENVWIEGGDPKEFHTSRLPKMRSDLNQMLGQASRNQAAYDYLTKLTLDAMTTIALGNYHPLARHSAVIVIGDLKDFNQTPMADAVPALIRCLGAQQEMVQIAALSGLMAHAKAGVPDKDKQALLAVLVKLVGDNDVGPSETADGKLWRRRRAVELLGTMKDQGPGNAVVTGLLAVVKNNKSPLSLSCAAARALGHFDLKSLGAPELAALAASVGQVGVDVCRAELTRAAELAAAGPLPISSGNALASVRGPGGDVLRPSSSSTPQYIAAAEVKSRLQSLEFCFKGASGKGLLAAVKGTAADAGATAVDKALLDLIAICDTPDPTYEALSQKLTQGVTTLEAAVGKLGGKGRAPAAGATDDGFGDAGTEPAAKTPDKAPPKTPPAGGAAKKPAA